MNQNLPVHRRQEQYELTEENIKLLEEIYITPEIRHEDINASWNEIEDYPRWR